MLAPLLQAPALIMANYRSSTSIGSLARLVYIAYTQKQRGA
jgi:hypothetical protein